jgi:hypothetical protein
MAQAPRPLGHRVRSFRLTACRAVFQLPALPPLVRSSVAWSHAFDKKSRRSNSLEQVLIEKVY